MSSPSEGTFAPTDGGPLLVVCSGPSAAGKDSILLRMRERGVDAHFASTATTRPRRDDDPTDDQLLSFLSKDDFERLLADDGLLEHAEVYGHHYGVPKAPIAEAIARGQDVVLRVDVQGAATIKRLVPATVLVFVMPPSMAEMEARMRARRRDEPDVLKRRLNEAEQELARVSEYDYAIINENDRLDEAVDRLVAIMQAERCRVGRLPVRL